MTPQKRGHREKGVVIHRGWETVPLQALFHKKKVSNIIKKCPLISHQRTLFDYI
jgi:hypothetical protein